MGGAHIYHTWQVYGLLRAMYVAMFTAIFCKTSVWVILVYFLLICDRIWENPPYGIHARFAQCAFVVAQVEICQSPDFVIYMSNNPSNCCLLLQRLVVLYEGEISLHFDPPSRHSHRTRSLLLWAVIRILYLDTARFIKLLYVCSPF